MSEERLIKKAAEGMSEVAYETFRDLIEKAVPADSRDEFKERMTEVAENLIRMMRAYRKSKKFKCTATYTIEVEIPAGGKEEAEEIAKQMFPLWSFEPNFRCEELNDKSAIRYVPMCPDCKHPLDYDESLSEKFNQPMYRCPYCGNVYPEYKIWWAKNGEV